MWLTIGSMVAFIAILEAQAIVAPYQVSIRSSAPTIVGYLPTNGLSKQICNGIIIRDKYILTTASCLFVQDVQTRERRLINPGEIFVIAGNISLNQADFGEEAKGSFRRNVVSVIPHGKFNASSGENDLAVLKVSQYPYTVVRNVSFFENWVCDAQRGPIAAGQTVVSRNGTCIEYRFSNPQSCWLDAYSLRRSEERGTGLICNFKLVAILAEINPPSNPQSCTSIKRTTAYYTMIEPYHDWIVSEIGHLYTAPSRPGINGTVATSGSMTPQLNPSGSAAPIPSWGYQQIATTSPASVPGKPKSRAAPSISTGFVFKLILFNLCIPFAFVYRFHH